VQNPSLSRRIPSLLPTLDENRSSSGSTAWKTPWAMAMTGSSDPHRSRTFLLTTDSQNDRLTVSWAFPVMNCSSSALGKSHFPVTLVPGSLPSLRRA